MKFLTGFIIVALFVAALWVGFGLWTGLYSLYSIPPSKTDANGATLLISREPREPMFNSVHYKSTVSTTPQKKTGIQFGSDTKPSRTLSERTILKLPFMQWAYQKSLEPQKLY